MTSMDDDYKVGYGRPPLESRFQPGESGNPKGRPRKLTTIGDDLHTALMQRVKISEKGRTRTMTLRALIFHNLAQDAARKNIAAARLLFALASRHELSDESRLNPAELDADDRAILESYISAARNTDAEPDLEG